MKKEDGVRSQICEESDSEADCGKSLNKEESTQGLSPSVAKPTLGTVTCDALLPDEQVSDVSDQGSEVTAAPSAGTAEAPDNKEEHRSDPDSPSRLSGSGDPVSADSDEKLPPCLEIMKRVMERSRESDDDSLTFTIEEMEFLAKDPLFARLDPAMASEIRKILDGWPPG